MASISGKVREYKLDNGLIVALQNIPTQTVAAKLRVNYGAFHEREDQKGMAHFLEHCLVTGGSSNYDIITADEIRSSFGDFNAITSLGRTSFTGNMLSEDIEKWLSYVSDHLFQPQFNKDRVNGERERVLREISDNKSNSFYHATIEFNNAFYRDHPQSRQTSGSEDIVRNATIDDLRAFHKRGYGPNNMDLIIAGDIPEGTEEQIHSSFGSWPAGEDTRTSFPPLAPLPEKVILHRAALAALNADNPDASSAHISLFYIGPVNGHEDEPSVWAMNNILGGNTTNSLLYQNVGLKKGLAYQASTEMGGAYNAGHLGIRVAVPAKRIDESIDAIFEEIERMKTQKVDDKTIERMKRVVKYNLARTFESNDGHIYAIEQKLDYGVTPELVLRKWDKVTPETVMEMANKYLPDKDNGKYVLYIGDPLYFNKK